MGLYITFPLTILVEIVFPVLLGYWIIRHYHTSWKLIGMGALIYLASQAVHIPLLDGVGWLFSNNVVATPTGTQLIITTAVISGLATSLCEETARLVGFKLLKAPVQTKPGAFSLGVGHGGLESILTAGLPMLGTFVAMLGLKNANPSDPNLDAATVQQVTALWGMGWYIPLAGAIERLVSITIQLTLTFIVLQVFIRKSYIWFAAALLWHAFIEGLLVGLTAMNLESGWILVVEISLGLISALMLWFLLKRTKESTPVAAIEGSLA